MRAAEAGTILDSAIATLDERQSALQTFGLTGMDLAPTVRYGATLRVLRDLLNQGWTIREDDEGIILDAPGRAAVRLDDPEAAKESIRRSFAFARDAQLREPSTLEFIRTTERRGVERLFTSGAELATRLTEQGTGGDPAGAPGDRARHPRRDDGDLAPGRVALRPPLLVDPVPEHARAQPLLSRPRRARCPTARSSASRRSATRCSGSPSAMTTSAGRRTASSAGCRISTPASAASSPAICSGCCGTRSRRPTAATSASRPTR